MKVTGRINQMPHEILNRIILKPQLEFELDNYFKHYLIIEKTFIKAYRKMHFIDDKQAIDLINAINKVTVHHVRKNAEENLTDIAFTIENEIDKNLNESIYCWHLDRSRNDFQACAQLMYARENTLNLFKQLNKLIEIILNKASKHSATIMPGFTHYQSAQVISVGFYLSAIVKNLIDTEKNLLRCIKYMNLSCPLGSGAMSGQEYNWNLNEMANDLGFDQYVGHALVGVASRDWILEIGNSFNLFGTNISRFLTDLMNWGSSEYKFIDFPDEFVSISSSMPQKKNFTILERIRGKSSHFASLYMDFILGQRNTPYSNLVEVSKESTKFLSALFKNAYEMFDLLTIVFENIQFKKQQLKEQCDEDFFGGFSLANKLSVINQIPYRTAQVIAGKFITESIESLATPKNLSLKLLNTICSTFGYKNKLSSIELHQIFSAQQNLYSKNSLGSTHPEQVLLTINNLKCISDKILGEFENIEAIIISSEKNLENWY